MKDMKDYISEWAARDDDKSEKGTYAFYIKTVRNQKGISRGVAALEIGIPKDKLIALEIDLIDRKSIPQTEQDQIENFLGIQYAIFKEKYSVQIPLNLLEDDLNEEQLLADEHDKTGDDQGEPEARTTVNWNPDESQPENIFTFNSASLA